LGRLGSAFPVTVLLVISAGCGSSSRQLQSMDISPATASGSPVQFVATGHYNQAPLSMSPLPAFWAVAPNDDPGATITQTGVAQCQPGASKTFSVLAYAPADPDAPIKIPLTGNMVLGTAFLSCP
jgi:hypothetical protein